MLVDAYICFPPIIISIPCTIYRVLKTGNKHYFSYWEDVNFLSLFGRFISATMEKLRSPSTSKPSSLKVGVSELDLLASGSDDLHAANHIR